MARSILISDDGDKGDVGFAYNTLVFDVISEGTRLKFLPEEHDCLKKCYEDLDEMGSEYICLYDVDARCFNAFRTACEEGLRELSENKEVAIDYVASHHEIAGMVALWEELIEALRHDRRNEVR